MKDYSEAIRQLRAKLGLSQYDLADMLNVSFATVNRWENGHFEPTIITQIKLEDLFEQNSIKLEELK